MCVRVTDMRGVDLTRYVFDYDLTFAVLLMHPDGTIYHRYGARDQRSASVWLGAESFERTLRETLAEHAEYAANPAPPPRAERLVLEDVPAFAAKDGGKCIHCHSVQPALAAEAKAAGTWRDTDMWRHPPPARIGLELDPADQRRVLAVEPGSAAELAGLRAGDALAALAGQRLLTVSDLSWVLDGVPVAGGRLALRFERAGALHDAELVMEPGWKIGTPLEFSWRPFKWELMPSPGFGGEDLDAEEKAARGLAPERFAFRVTYFVERGEQKPAGQAAKGAGLAKADVVIGADGRRDFANHDHFQTWWRLERAPGDTVRLELQRDGAPVTLEIPVPK